MKTKIYFGSDHAGFLLKKNLIVELSKKFPEYEFCDLGCESENSVDYPDYAEKVARAVVANKTRGVLVCGSGIGIVIAANKIDGIRAATVWDATSARLSKEHNDTNIIAVGSRLIGSEVALDAIALWLKTEFSGNRHQKRVDLITQLEKKNV